VLASLQRLREPAAIVVLSVLGIGLALAAVRLIMRLGTAQVGHASSGAVVLAAGYSLTDGLTIVTLTLLVACCTAWSATTHARLLTQLSLAVIGVEIAAALVLSLVGLTLDSRATTAVDYLSFLLSLVIPVLALLALWRVLAVQPKASSSTSAETAELESSTGQTGSSSTQPELEAPVEDPQNRPIWQRDEAAGAVWYTASDAASGAAASGWAGPGEPAGWQPIPSPPDAGPPESGRPTPESPARPVP
jgi:hypothetical protein